MVHPSLRIPYPSHLRKFQPNALMAQQPLMESFSILSLSSRVLPPIYSAKASHAQLPDTPLRSDTQALRLIANTPLIQRREKHRSREEKSTFT